MNLMKRNRTGAVDWLLADRLVAGSELGAAVETASLCMNVSLEMLAFCRCCKHAQPLLVALHSISCTVSYLQGAIVEFFHCTEVVHGTRGAQNIAVHVQGFFSLVHRLATHL